MSLRWFRRKPLVPAPLPPPPPPPIPGRVRLTMEHGCFVDGQIKDGRADMERIRLCMLTGEVLSLNERNGGQTLVRCDGVLHAAFTPDPKPE